MGNGINMDWLDTYSSRSDAYGTYKMSSPDIGYGEGIVTLPDDKTYVMRYYSDDGNIYWDGERGNTQNIWYPCPLRPQLECISDDDCQQHTYCNQSTNTCVRECDSFAIDEYLIQCSAEFNENEVEIGHIFSDLNDLSIRIDGVDTNLQQEVSGLELTISNGDTQVQSLISGVNNALQGQIDDVNNELSNYALQSVVDTLAGQVNEIKTTLSNYASATTVEALAADINNIQDTIVKLQDDIDGFGTVSAKSWSSGLIDAKNTNLTGFTKDNLIIVLLLVNIMTIIISVCIYVRLCNNKQNYSGISKKGISDEERPLNELE